MVLPHVSVRVGQLPYTLCELNSTTLPLHSGIDSPGIGTHIASTEYVSSVFEIPPQSASGQGHTPQGQLSLSSSRGR